MNFKVTCMCGYVHHFIRVEEERPCRCGVSLTIRPRAAGHYQPYVQIPEGKGINVTEYIRKSKFRRPKMEMER